MLWYINTQDLNDYGSMGASWHYTGEVSYTMCHQDGTYYTDVTKSSAEPVNPNNGAIWIDITDGSAKEWSAYTETWTVLETVYTRVDFTTMGQVPGAFKEYDGVNITGLYDDDLNGSKILYAVGGDATNADYIVVIGIQEEQHTQQGANVSIERSIPAMDYVCEAQKSGARLRQSVRSLFIAPPFLCDRAGRRYPLRCRFLWCREGVHVGPRFPPFGAAWRN